MSKSATVNGDYPQRFVASAAVWSYLYGVPDSSSSKPMKGASRMMFEPFAGRLQRFRKLMEEKGVDVFLVAVPQNRYYISGFEADDLLPTESSGYLLITHSDQ